MHLFKIRDARETDYPLVVDLNAKVVEFTSAMDIDRVKFLASLSTYFRIAEAGERMIAFLMAMQAGAAYENIFFEWFSSHYKSFLYVDRIVVDENFCGQGVGTSLYNDLFKFAQERKIPVITCEINAVPPNKRSAEFHASLGFHEVGSQWVCDGHKKVSKQALYLE